MGKQEKDGHTGILVVLYVLAGILVIYKIARTLDAVLSKAPTVKKEKPFAIDRAKGVLVGVHKFISSLSENLKNKKRGNDQ